MLKKGNGSVGINRVREEKMADFIRHSRISFKATKRGATIKKVIAYCAVQRVLLLLLENLSHTSFSVTRQFSIIYSNQKHSQLYLKVTGTVIKV